MRIVAVDLQEMAPIEGVVQLQGDITDGATVQVRPDARTPHACSGLRLGGSGPRHLSACPLTTSRRAGATHAATQRPRPVAVAGRAP